jgi:hypothetical protein
VNHYSAAESNIYWFRVLGRAGRFQFIFRPNSAEKRRWWVEMPMTDGSRRLRG